MFIPSTPLVLIVLSVATLWQARRAGRNPLIWIAILWALGYLGAIVIAIAVIETALRVLSLDFLETYGDTIGFLAPTFGALAGGSIAVAGAGWPLPSFRQTDAV